MIYLGLDLGEVSLGIARSDSGIIANPVDTFYFRRGDYNKAVSYIVDYIQKESVNVVVLGLPKHMNNDVGDRANISIWFKEEILKQVTVEIILWDERLTTRQATYTLKQAGLSEAKRKAKKDTLAAQIILQNYLDYKGETYER